MPDVEQLLEYIRRNGRWQSVLPNNLARAPSLLYGDGEINFAAGYYQPRLRGIVASLFSFFLLLLLLLPIPFAERRAYSASLPMSVPHPERGRLCIPPPSFLPFLLLSFLPLPLASPPLVNLLINDDCKPDNAIFIPPPSFSTRDSLLLFSYIYMYICILLISIQNNDKTFSTTNVYYSFRPNSLNSFAFRQIKKIFGGAFDFTNCLVHGREFIEI